ncbi:MAG TPA: cytochrome C oxidase subunit IV family protein [Gemmatimonadales bacterium]|nr:cytochrome C oxidase subunit IV family protein [Gemmatimonadales bacterium]
MTAPVSAEALGLAAHEHHHPSTATYLKVGITLIILTAVEVGIYYVPQMRPILVPCLLILAIAKFALVAAFYMHLKTDSRLFSGLFLFPLLIAVVIVIGLIALMAYHFAFAISGHI